MNGKLKATKLVKDIEGYLADLQKHLPLDEETLMHDKDTEYIISFLIEQIANDCMNLGNNIISAFDLPMPQTGKEIFEILEKEHIIKKQIAEYMKDVVSVRNIIAHRYTDLSKESIIELLEKISFADEFLSQIVAGIEKKERNIQR